MTAAWLAARQAPAAGSAAQAQSSSGNERNPGRPDAHISVGVRGIFLWIEVAMVLVEAPACLIYCVRSPRGLACLAPRTQPWDSVWALQLEQDMTFSATIPVLLW